jgi:hypothetical protein
VESVLFVQIVTIIHNLGGNAMHEFMDTIGHGSVAVEKWELFWKEHSGIGRITPLNRDDILKLDDLSVGFIPYWAIENCKDTLEDTRLRDWNLVHVRVNDDLDQRAFLLSYNDGEDSRDSRKLILLNVWKNVERFFKEEWLVGLDK